jgi:uncharacterized YigZ family protein
MSDHYRTIAARCEFTHKIERSEFLGIALPMADEEGFFAELHSIEKRFFDATHHCWAFRLRSGDDVRARSSDAGEPSGTAGKPILSAIEGADLHDVGVVVVRWFGGIKLGTGGLSRAYRQTAAETLGHTQPLDRYVYVRFRVVAPFDALGTIYRFVNPPDVVLAGERFGETNEFDFLVRQSRAAGFERSLAERRLPFVIV